MSRVNLEDNKAFRTILQSGIKTGVMRLAIAGATMTWDADSPHSMTIDPAQALTLTLPAVTNNRGLRFEIWHQSTGNFDITISSPVDRTGAAGVTTIGTVSQNEGAIVYCDGVSWFCGVLKQT